MKPRTNHTFILSFLAVCLWLSLFISITPFLTKAADGARNQKSISFSCFFNPLLTITERFTKDFRINIALATTPDPDSCGYTDDFAYCVGAYGPNTAAVDIDWPAIYPTQSTYTLTIKNPDGSVFGNWNTGAANGFRLVDYTASRLANSTTYTWQVEAYWGYQSSSYWGYTGQPHGSFTTPNCNPSPSCLSNCSTWGCFPCVPRNGGCGTTSSCDAGCSECCGIGTHTCHRNCDRPTPYCNGAPCGNCNYTASCEIDTCCPPPSSWCPFLYSWNGQKYVKDTTFIYKLDQPQKEQDQLRELKYLATGGDSIKAKIVEEEQEISYLNRIQLLVVDKQGNKTKQVILKPIYASRDLDKILNSDNQYLITKQGDEVLVEFNKAPALKSGWTRQVFIKAKGYYQSLK